MLVSSCSAPGSQAVFSGSCKCTVRRQLWAIKIKTHEIVLSIEKISVCFGFVIVLFVHPYVLYAYNSDLPCLCLHLFYGTKFSWSATGSVLRESWCMHRYNLWLMCPVHLSFENFHVFIAPPFAPLLIDGLLVATYLTRCCSARLSWCTGGYYTYSSCCQSQ